MSSITPDAVRSEVQNEATNRASADSALQDGTSAFSRITISGVANSATSVGSITGRSTLTDTASLYTTLVAAAGATTFTTTGYVRVSIVDSAGNITDGDHYIQIGTLS